MAEENSDEWELSKENVQPLKQGRSFAQLSAALKPNQTALRQQQEKFEMEIRVYAGDDPLDVWVRYITWTEQNFPKGGNDGSCHVLIQKCLVHFKEDSRYFNDPRFIRLWIKFADYNTNPGDIYQFLHSNKIGSELAEFYEAWAFWLERCGSTKMADSVFREGIEVGAQPIDRLRKRHNEFQARVARGAIESMKTADEPGDEDVSEPGSQRSTLGVLRPHGKTGQAPVSRITSRKPDKFPQAVASHQVPLASSGAIYCDENASSSRLPPQNKEFSQVPLPEVMSRENQQRPAKWNEVKVKQKGIGGGLSHRAPEPSFVPYEDTDVKQPLFTPHKVADGTGILSVRQETTAVSALDKLQSNDDGLNQKAMYCKEKVDVGVREFSFEELRAARWLQKKREEEAFNLKVEQEVNRQLQTALQKMNLDKIAAHIGNESSVTDSIAQQPQPSLLATAGSSSSEPDDVHMQEVNEEQSVDQRNVETDQASIDKFSDRTFANVATADKSSSNSQLLVLPSPMVTAKPIAVVTPKPVFPAVRQGEVLGKQPLGDFFDPRHADEDVCEDVEMKTPDVGLGAVFRASSGSRDVSHLTKPSPTVHTKLAQEVVRNMFCFDGSIKQSQSDLEFENQFLLDETARVTAPFEIYQDPVPNSCQKDERMPTAVPFVIYEDPTPNVFQQENSTKPNVSSFAVHQDVVPQQTSVGFKIFEDSSPPKKKKGLRALPLSAVKVAEDPLPPNVPETKQAFAIYEDVPEQPSTAFAIYEDPILSNVGRGSMGEFHSGAASTTSATGCRMKRPLADHVVPVVPSADEPHENVGSAFTAVETQDDWEAGIVMQPSALSSRQQMTAVHLDAFADDPTRKDTVHFSDEIICKSGNIEMKDVEKWTNQDFDLASDLTFDPAISSTRNLTNMVRFAAESGCLAQPQNKQMVANVVNVPQPFESGSENTRQRNAKSPYFYALDTIQEGNEDSKSRLSSFDSRSSSSRRLTNTGSSGSSGSRSSIQQYSSLASSGSSSKHLASSAHTSTHLADSRTLSSGHSCAALPALELSEAVVDNQFEATHTRPFAETNPTNVQADVPENVLDPGVLEEQPEESMYVDHGKSMMDASIFIDYKNPFNDAHIQTFLKNLSPPLDTYSNYRFVDSHLPRFSLRSKVRMGDKTYMVKEKLGQGGFAKVFHIVETTSCDVEGKEIVAKVQTPPCPWEFYVTTELHRRLSQLQTNVDISPSVMLIDEAFFFSDGSCFLNERHKHGTLLDFVNARKLSKRPTPEWLTLFLSIELFHIVEQMHRCEIIHGDFKPDNILLCQPRRLEPTESAHDLIRGSTSFLKLIDFGQGIDMTMFPPGTTFMTSVPTQCFQCPEMQSNQPWTYQTDLFGLVATIHVLLVGSYMNVCRMQNRWTTSVNLPRASKARDIWKQIFSDFLNIPDCDSLPNLEYYRTQLEAIFLQEFSAEAYNSFIMEYICR